jgi:hypothetical protein
MREREIQQLLSRIRQLERQVADNQLPQDIGLVTAGGGSGRLFRTRPSGIPAASGSVWGSAICDEHDELGADLGTDETIYIQRTAIVPGNVFILVLAVGSRLFVWESNCPTTIPEPDPEDPDPEPDPEPPVQ